jgi:signal transduction histidine kinase
MARERELKILMLEDLQDDVGLIERALRKEGMLFIGRRVDCQEEFSESLETFQPDVILSDHALPQFNSLEALKICRKQTVNVPFILVTGTVSEEFAVSCLKQGADDYVLKSNMVRLPSAIQNALRQRQQEMKRKKAESTLRKQNEELIKINKELDSFVYSVSHNLRAPLMSVLGLINLVQLESRNGDPGMNGYFEMMQHSIHKLDETLKEILDYSRNARSALKIADIDIRKLIEDAFDRLKYIEGSDTISKTIEITGSSLFCTDPYRLSVIVNNLVSNAIKYRDLNKADQNIRVSLNITDTQLEMVLADNGIGIANDQINKVFEMFYRATERSEGAGLGLYIVRETVDKLGGNISVTSAPGIGTTFFLVLPDLSRPSPDGKF